MSDKSREPLFNIVKRSGISKSKAWAIRAAAIIIAFVVCGIITMAITGQNPINVYITFAKGAFGSSRRIWVTFQNLSILLIISLALTPAFKMRFWNIGGEGQVLMGCLASAACMIELGDKVPNAVLIILMVVSSIAAGAVWGLIPAIFKARWNTNETLFTLMMNYIATQLVAYFIIIWEVPKGSGTVGIINMGTEAGYLPQLFGSKYLLTIIVAAGITVFMHVYLKYSKHGYELSVVGESENTARYVGINVKEVIMRTMLLSGGICGIAGLLLTGGINHTITTTLAGGNGFTAVMMSWLAKFSPVGMVFTSLLVTFMNRGASEVSTIYGLNQSFSDILTGIILFFIIGCEFFIQYKMIFRGRGKAAETVTVEAKGPETAEGAASPDAEIPGKESEGK